METKIDKPQKKAARRVPTVKRKRRHSHPCCSDPTPENHSNWWADGTGLCAKCHKYLRYGDGPLKNGAWSK